MSWWITIVHQNINLSLSPNCLQGHSLVLGSHDLEMEVSVQVSTGAVNNSWTPLGEMSVNLWTPSMLGLYGFEGVRGEFFGGEFVFLDYLLYQRREFHSATDIFCYTRCSIIIIYYNNKTLITWIYMENWEKQWEVVDREGTIRSSLLTYS